MARNGESRSVPHGLYPFWFWNADLSESEIRWQIEEMADKGVRGFYIHPRQGLKQPYLSRPFFRMVEVAIEAAEEHGLLVNLYDEYPYPSGVAGGEVILGNPQFQATKLLQTWFDVPGGTLRRALPRGKILSCHAYPLVDGRVDWARGINLADHSSQSSIGIVLADESYNETGLTQYNQKRYFASNPTPTLQATLPQGPHRIFVSVQATVDHHKYWGHYVDVLNPQAVAQFLQLTHERYRRQFGARFGTRHDAELGGRIHAIFVDETTAGWSDRLPAAFQEEYGYDLLPLLPALQDETHPQHAQVAFDLDRLQYQLFCKSFETQISGWCAAHHLRYAGEKPSQRLSQLKYMDIPGCEPGHTKAGAPFDMLRPRIRQNARATASAAYLYGKEGALCECFHSLGWSGTLQDAKLISEGLLLMGIRYLVPHGFFYTTHALAKHDAPPTFFFQMPYWPLFGVLSRRLDKIGACFEGTHIDATILVIDPNSGLPSEAHLADYERLLRILSEEHLDFLIVDTDVLESATVTPTGVRVREVEAALVLLPPMRVVEAPLQHWLNALESAGHMNALLRLQGGFDEEECAAHLRARIRPHLRLRSIEGDARSLYVVTRTDGQRRLWFLLNVGAEKVRVELWADSLLCEIPLDDALPATLVHTGDRYERTVYPFESFMLQAGDDLPQPALPPVLRVPIEDPVKVQPLNQNLLRMHRWRMTLLDDDGTPLQSADVSAIPIANQLAEGRFRFAPQIDTFFGCTPELRLPALKVTYQCEFHVHTDLDFGRPIELVMEPGSICGEWRIQVNDSSPFDASAFRTTGAHVRGSLGLDVTPLLERGVNKVTVSVQTDRLDGGLRNPLYLAGSFGVLLDPPTLTNRPALGGFEKWAENGLPFYAGVVVYQTSFELEELPASKDVLLEIDPGDHFREACETSINDGPWHAMPWSPYRVLLPSSEVRQGRNAIQLRVYTTLIRAFEGQWFDAGDHCYRNVGEGE